MRHMADLSEFVPPTSAHRINPTECVSTVLSPSLPRAGQLPVRTQFHPRLTYWRTRLGERVDYEIAKDRPISNRAPRMNVE